MEILQPGCRASHDNAEVVSAYLGLQESNILSQSLSAICPGNCEFEAVSGQS